jgi:DNA-binding SARP family transcriptional activator
VDAGIRISLLGPVQISVGDGPVSVPGAKLAALVAALALAVPHAVSGERLIEEIWGDVAPGNPTNALQAQVSQLRRQLGATAVVRQGAGYALAADPDDVDALRFEVLVRAARDHADRHEHRAAAEGFAAALATVRGAPLEDLLDHRFAREAATRLGELVLVAHEGRADAELAAGRHSDAVVALSALVRDHPLHERFHAQLMLALYRSGRQADALRAYRDARALLIEELGVEPGPELRELERAVLAHDPTLASPARAEAPVLAAPDRAGADTAAGGAGSAAPSRRRAPIVGRDLELSVLRTDLDAACAGSGRVALVGGEPGIGKSRLAEELADAAAAQGAVVVWGRCYEGRGAPAFWPWTQVVQSLLVAVDDDLLRRALGAGLGDIALVVPEVKELVDHVEPPPQVDPESARFRFFEAIARFLRRLAVDRPLLVVLDDLHWADGASLQLLTFMSADIDTAAIAVVATYRDLDPLVGEALGEALGELARRAAVRRVQLQGLDRDALGRLVEARGGALAPDVVASLHDRTQGNPFFLTEMLRLLPAGAALDAASDVVRVVPTGVRDVVRSRVARLAPADVELLTTAAVLGQHLDLGLLADVVGVDAASLLERLEPAMAAGIVVEGGGPGRFRFSHGLVNETLYEDLGVGRRARLHQRAAEAIEARHGGAEGRHLLALATHWFQAVPAAPPERGIDAALRAARWSQRHLAHEQAIEQLRGALDLVAGMPQGPVRWGRELEVQDDLSVALLTTAGYSAPGVDEACARMQELGQALGGHPSLVPALWRLSIAYCVRMELDTALDLGRQLQALAAATDDPATRLVAHMALGTAHTHRGELVAGRTHLDAAVAACEAGDDLLVTGVAETPAVWARVFSAWNWWLLGDADRAEAQVTDAVTRALGAGDHTYGATFAVWFSSLVASLRRDLDTARRRCDHGIEIATAAGFGMFVPFMVAIRGWATALGAAGEGPGPGVGAEDARGGPTGSDALAEGVAAITAMAAGVRASGARLLLHWFPALEADVELHAGRPREALAAADAGVAEAEATGERWFEPELHRLRAAALVQLGDADGARLALDHALTLAAAQGSGCLHARATADRAALDPA